MPNFFIMQIFKNKNIRNSNHSQNNSLAVDKSCNMANLLHSSKQPKTFYSKKTSIKPNWHNVNQNKQTNEDKKIFQKCKKGTN